MPSFLLQIDGLAGSYVLSVWWDGREQKLPCELGAPSAAQVLQLVE